MFSRAARPGTAIGLLVENVDQKSGDYSKIKDSFRPGHADYTYQQKYGIRDYRGGGRASARETVMRVAAGAIARKYLAEQLGLKIRGYLAEIGPFKLRALDLEHVDDNAFFCADPDKLPQLEVFLDELRRAGDSIGARINLIASGVPVGLGEPVFDKLEGEIAKGLMSINAVKGVEFGDGFECVRQRGSEHRDELTPDGFKKNSSGGTLGRYLERSGHSRQHRSETDVEHPSAGRDRRQGRARHRDRDDGPARPLRGLASDADRGGDARAHADGSLLTSSRSERRRALQRAGADGSAKPLEVKDVRAAAREARHSLAVREYYGKWNARPALEARPFESRTRITVRVARKLLNSAPDVSRRARFRHAYSRRPRGKLTLVNPFYVRYLSVRYARLASWGRPPMDGRVAREIA